MPVIDYTANALMPLIEGMTRMWISLDANDQRLHITGDGWALREAAGLWWWEFILWKPEQSWQDLRIQMVQTFYSIKTEYCDSRQTHVIHFVAFHPVYACYLSMHTCFCFIFFFFYQNIITGYFSGSLHLDTPYILLVISITWLCIIIWYNRSFADHVASQL